MLGPSAVLRPPVGGLSTGYDRGGGPRPGQAAVLRTFTFFRPSQLLAGVAIVAFSAPATATTLTAVYTHSSPGVFALKVSQNLDFTAVLQSAPRLESNWNKMRWLFSSDEACSADVIIIVVWLPHAAGRASCPACIKSDENAGTR